MNFDVHGAAARSVSNATPNWDYRPLLNETLK
jgi:hypothetical protein